MREVQCDFQIVEDLKNYLAEEPRQPIESTISALVTATKQLTGKFLPVQAVYFKHPSPRDRSEHQKFFQVSVEFSHTANRIIFPKDCLSWSIRSANSKLLSVFENHAVNLLKLQSNLPSYSEQVALSITEKLPESVPGIEAIACRLMMSVRQLQRELHAEHTSYQQVLDLTRRNLALQYLLDPQTSIHDLAFLLGFSEPSAFHRAFKRWTGETPRNYRTQNHIKPL